MNTTPYPPPLADLLAHPCRMPLGPGAPAPSVEDRIRQLEIPDVRDDAAARACRAGLWLRFNHLDESHTISQDVHTVEGSAWHAVMHRREPDAGNSKYWWRKVGPHLFVAELAAQTPAVGYAYTTPEAFVDFCEKVRDTGTDAERLAEAVQELEWRLLFEHCYRLAVDELRVVNRNSLVA